MLQKALDSLIFLFFIPLFRYLIPFFIKKTSTLLGENWNGFFTPSFKILLFISKYVVPIMVVILLYNIWF